MQKATAAASARPIEQPGAGGVRRRGRSRRTRRRRSSTPSPIDDGVAETEAPGEPARRVGRGCGSPAQVTVDDGSVPPVGLGVTPAGWNSSMRFPDGSQARTWEPPGPVTTSLRNVTPAAARRAISRVEVVDDEVDPVPPARAGAARRRPSGRPRSSAGRTAAAAGCRAVTSAKAGSALSDGEAEVAGVEVDARGDVVDEVPDVDGGVISHGWSFRWVWVEIGERGGRRGPRARRRRARNAGYDASSVSPAAAGSAMLQWRRRRPPGNSGQISRTLSQSVMTRSKRVRAKRSRCLVVSAGDVDAALGHHPHGVRVERLGMAPGAAGVDGAARAIARASASAICDRALLPVHRNRTRGRRGRGWRRPASVGGASRRPGWSAPPGVGEEVAAAEQVGAVVDVAAVGRAAPGA